MKKLTLSLLLLLLGALALSHAAQADAPAPQTHLMWNCVDGRISFWWVGDDGSLRSKEYGPYAGWTAKALADSADGVTNVLWTRTSDGKISLWRMDSAGNLTSAEYGPFPGWSATALSRFAPGTGALTGPAGGDLFGIYPNPTVAPNAIDHTKLASDAASLSQVSGGNLTANANGATVNGSLGITDHIYCTNWGGFGGGISAQFVELNGISPSINGGLGRALVNNGAAGLVLNYAHDFGNLDIQSDTYIHGSTSIFGSLTSVGNITTPSTISSGTINSSGDINAARFIHSGSNIFSDLGVLAAGGMHAGGDISTDAGLNAKSLQITGGSDLAEPYKIAASAQVQPLPGLVVSIDPNQTGQMRVATRAYDNTVGGIISGAGGVQPGVVLRQAGTVADGALPIASVGRVWCWCDADAGGAITPGDLLTTSDTPGHAMRVRDHDKARGAILGKAMSPLKTGKGLVLVLVTLE